MGLHHLFIGIVRLYQWVLSPAMRFLIGTSGACRYSPTCSCYAVEALQRHGAWRGLRLSVSRLLRCHPWGGAGADPVPSHPDPDRFGISGLMSRTRLASKSSGGIPRGRNQSST